MLVREVVTGETGLKQETKEQLARLASSEYQQDQVCLQIDQLRRKESIELALTNLENLRSEDELELSEVRSVRSIRSSRVTRTTEVETIILALLL